MDEQKFNRRFLILFILLGVLVAACIIRLFDLQVVKGAGYRKQAEERLVQAVPVKAPRGEILDRYGEPLVENRMGYSVQFQKVELENEDLNAVVDKVCDLVLDYGGGIESDFPVVYDSKTKELVFDMNAGADSLRRKTKKTRSTPTASASATASRTPKSTAKPEEDVDEERAAKLKEQNQEKLDEWKKANKLMDYDTPDHVLNFYKDKYKISDRYSQEETLTIAAVRYAMDKSAFSRTNPYTLSRDVDAEVTQKIKERNMEFPGVDIAIDPIRSFAEGTMAAHILGRTGKIYAEEYEELKAKGYGMNDIVGKEGMEKVLEPYLKGTDGYKSVEMDRGGSVTQILQSQPAVPGNYAKLTIDKELQRAMEESLQKNITEAVNRNGAGAAIAVNPSNGDVLAMASYPSYDPDTFTENYESLLKAKSNPLFNRVLNGTYSPGSTFKPLTAIAGLESGAISTDTYIVDRGRYTYYKSYQPTCLIYSSTGSTHGSIEVSEAIGVSCNYFFYETGRLTTIETIDEYASKFGLGESTGIELPESRGLLASPKHREEIGAEWYPGDVLQAAIGQSDNMFTPAQLAEYIATFLNKGKRVGLHLLDEVASYDMNQVVYKKEPEILSDTPISDSTYEAVRDGMRQVVSSGTARAAFATSKYKAAGKTGTAEVPDGADNVLFVGFAPYENPEIVIAVIVEHGASSSYPAKVARDVFDAYMELKEERENPKPTNKPDREDDEGESDGAETKSGATAKPSASSEPKKSSGATDTASPKSSASPASSAGPKGSASPSATGQKTTAPTGGKAPSASSPNENRAEGQGTL